LGSITSPKSQFDSKERNILDWEVAKPQEGRGVASGGIRACTKLIYVGKGDNLVTLGDIRGSKFAYRQQVKEGRVLMLCRNIVSRTQQKKFKQPGEL
jgi:hypothetical protein